MKNGLLWILSDLDSAGRGRKRDEGEGGTRRKEGRGGRSDEEEGATRREKKMKNWLEDALLTSGSCLNLGLSSEYKIKGNDICFHYFYPTR